MVFTLFLIIDLYFLIAAVIAQFFNPIAQLVIPIVIPTKEARAEMETRPVIVEGKIRKLYKPFCAFYSSVHFVLFLLLKISCFIYIF